MSSITSTPVFVSRPKIHRLPANITRKNSYKYPLPRALVLGVAFVAVAAFSLYESKQQTVISEKSVLAIPTVPSISVSPQTSIISDSAIGEAQASTGMAALPEKSSKIISLHGESEYIVGQMAKIPVENEQITEIKAVNDIDNKAGRELLSIISKY